MKIRTCASLVSLPAIIFKVMAKISKCSEHGGVALPVATIYVVVLVIIVYKHFQCGKCVYTSMHSYKNIRCHLETF